MTEYDYATDIAVKQEEAYAIGRTIVLTYNLPKKNLSPLYKKLQN